MHRPFCHRLRVGRVLHRRGSVEDDQGYKYEVDGVDTKPSISDNSSITSVGLSDTGDSSLIPNLAAPRLYNPAERSESMIGLISPPQGRYQRVVVCKKL